jgi:hypothetical protein
LVIGSVQPRRPVSASGLQIHIVKGYTVNEQRLREESTKLQEMRQTMELLTRTLAVQELVTDTGKDVLKVITDYAYALTLLDRYDHGTLNIEGITRKALHVIDYDEGIQIVNAMKGEFDGLFGIEKDQGFKSPSEPSIRLSKARNCIRVSRKRGPISSTLLLKTTLSVMVTSGLPPPCLSISLA